MASPGTFVVQGLAGYPARAVRVQTPTWATVLQSMMDARLASFYTAMPGVVTAFDATSQRASVQPAVQGAYMNEAGVRVAERLPVVTDVPVIFPSITFPLPGGSSVLLVFASCAMDKWLTSGGEVDPKDERRNCLTDAVAIPFLSSAKNALEDVPEDAVVVWPGPDNDLRLGGPSTANAGAVARSKDVKATIIGVLSDAGVAGALVAYASGGAPALPALTTALNTYFVANPAAGSSIVTAVD